MFPPFAHFAVREGQEPSARQPDATVSDMKTARYEAAIEDDATGRSAPCLVRILKQGARYTDPKTYELSDYFLKDAGRSAGTSERRRFNDFFLNTVTAEQLELLIKQFRSNSHIFTRWQCRLETLFAYTLAAAAAAAEISPCGPEKKALLLQ